MIGFVRKYQKKKKKKKLYKFNIASSIIFSGANGQLKINLILIVFYFSFTTGFY